jgi:hypothetical protein
LIFSLGKSLLANMDISHVFCQDGACSEHSSVADFAHYR